MMALVGAAETHQRLGIEQQPKLGIRSPHQPATSKLYALPVPDLGCALTTCKRTGTMSPRAGEKETEKKQKREGEKGM